MDEAALKRSLKKALLEVIPGSVVLRHEDQFAGGRSDISVHVRRRPTRTAWAEVKYSRPDSSGRVRPSRPTALQSEFLRDVDGFLVTYRLERGSGLKSVAVELPRREILWEIAGHDHKQVAGLVHAYLQEDEDRLDLVRRFHHKFGLPMPDAPVEDWETARTRADHVAEEARELLEAVEARDMPGLADALADLEYLVLGTAVNLGLPHRSVFAEVHRANMRKERRPGAPGQSTSRQGIVKPEGWRGPDVDSALRAAGWRRGEVAA